jgi:hypothetical protein
MSISKTVSIAHQSTSNLKGLSRALTLESTNQWLAQGNPENKFFTRRQQRDSVTSS